jgi:hypothetical protein
MLMEFAPVLLTHLEHPDYSNDEYDSDDLPPLRQIWLPNPTHVTMLHNLAFAYARTTWGDRTWKKILSALGRAAGWLFRESQRPGQVTVMDATAALRESFTFPADDLRQQHLGFLLAWLETKGDRNSRIAAATLAEQESVATALDPALERSRLDQLVETWDEARRGNRKPVMRSAEKDIRQILSTELNRRLDLLERARIVLLEDKRPVSMGVERLTSESQKEHWYQYLRLESRVDDENDGPAFVPHPETDYRPQVAASRYYIMEASAELLRNALIHDDTELQDEAIARGDAFRGQIVRVQDNGGERRIDPIWSVHVPSAGPLRLKEGSSVMLLGDGKIQGPITSIRDKGSHGREITIAITGGKTRSVRVGRSLLPLNDGRLTGTAVAFAASDSGFFMRKKSGLVWRSDGPGNWLTHRVSGRGETEQEEGRD